MSKIVCIDAGHGGRDSGAVNGSRYEKYDTLRFSNALKNELSSQGVKVIMTRKEDKYVTLRERTDFANKNKADFFISLHRNAFTNYKANGVENWIYFRPQSATEGFAKSIMNELVKVGVQSDRGVKQGNFHVTRETKMPACLLEMGFISNKKDNELFDKKIYLYAKAISKAICNQLGVPIKDDDVVDDDDGTDGASSRLYRVQVGAFRYPENAKMVATQLNQKGFPAIII